MSSKSNPKKLPVEAHLHALHAVRLADPLPVDALREAMRHPTNVVVAKAATIAGARQATALAPDVATAAKRFFDQPDLQCLAKIATVRALKELEQLEPDLFYRGLRHVQMEPSWGGPVDTAGPLRAISALAISECRAIPARDALRTLIDALPDKELHTRIDVVRAIGQLTTLEADAVLRTKARLGDAEPEVVGQCLLSLVERDWEQALPFAAGFLGGAELRAEAAMAIAAHRGIEALALLTQAWDHHHDRELLLAIGTLRIPQAVEWLIPLLPATRQALEPCRHIPGVEDALAQSR